MVEKVLVENVIQIKSEITIKKWWGDGIGGEWLIYNRVWEGGQRVGIIF